MTLLFLACSTCLTDDEQRRTAYYAMTAVMLLTPVLVSGLVWLYLRTRL